MSDSKSKNRLPRTGTLLLIGVVLVVVGGAMMVWLPYHREQQVIAEIERLGGKTESEIVRPLWIPDSVDDEYLDVFEKVSKVDLSGTQVGDAGLEHLRGLTNLQELILTNTQVSDAGLEHIRQLTNLETLWLESTQVSDEGLEHLREMTNLQELSLRFTKTTLAGRKTLEKALPNCGLVGYYGNYFRSPH